MKSFNLRILWIINSKYLFTVPCTIEKFVIMVTIGRAALRTVNMNTPNPILKSEGNVNMAHPYIMKIKPTRQFVHSEVFAASIST